MGLALEKGQERKGSENARSAIERSFPWERQPSESPQAFARFLAYRDTAPGERSIRKLGVSMQLAARWSRKWRWVARTVAYDAWLLELSDATANHAVLRHKQALARFGSLSVDKASKTVAQLSETKLSADEAIALAVNGAKLARQALGLNDGETPASRAPVAQVAVSFGSGSLNWANRPEPNTIKVVPCDEQVIAEGVPALVHTVSTKTVNKLPPRQPLPNNKRLAELIVPAPKAKGGANGGGTVHSRSEGKVGGDNS
jgi:hypothetical protein